MYGVLEQNAPATCRVLPRDWRRRSADVGGLHLATEGQGQGQGWMGGDSFEVQTIYAELLSDMYTETLNSVNDNSLDSVPADLPESVRSRLIHSLDRWHFEPHKLPEEEVLSCTLILFESLFRIEGMQQVIPLSMQQISAFIHHLRRIYRYENTYHNFEHALDVLQASQSYLKSAGMVPPPTILFEPNRLWNPRKVFDSGSVISCLGLRELFMLYIAAIGHDVGHPGFSNGFMKNAKTPLSLVYDNSSALEQMHCQLLLRVMRHHGLGVLLDDAKHGNHFRKILWQSVIATDMGVHEDFMQRFKRLIDGEAGSLCLRQVVVCQAILKNADISNPTRPFLVSKHWANALMQEWTAQAHLEEEYELQQTVMSSDDPIKEAESQIFFITRFAKPLLQLTVKAVPEMAMYLFHCKSNLQTWVKRKAELVKSRQNDSAKKQASSSSSSLPPPSIITTSSPVPSLISPTSPPPPTSPRQSDWYLTAFPLTLPTYHPKTSLYAPSTRSDHESISILDSPCESESSLLSPVSDSSSSNHCPSSASGSGSCHRQRKESAAGSVASGCAAAASSTNGSGSLCVPAQNTPHAAIRAASRLGSIRQKDKASLGLHSSCGFNTTTTTTKRGSRNSWCAATTTTSSSSALSMAGLTALFQSSSSSLTPPSPSPSPIVSAVASGQAGAGMSTVNTHPPPPPPVGSFLMTRPIKLQVLP